LKEKKVKVQPYYFDEREREKQAKVYIKGVVDIFNRIFGAIIHIYICKKI
jgi:hypothetical protein